MKRMLSLAIVMAVLLGGVSVAGAQAPQGSAGDILPQPDSSGVRVDAQNTMHVGGIEAELVPGPQGHPLLVMYVTTVDHNDEPLGEVFVETTIEVPGREVGRARYSHFNGVARFWSPAWHAGYYTLCVDDLTLEGFIYDPDANVATCMLWNVWP